MRLRRHANRSFPPDQPEEHNGMVTEDPAGMICPRCRSSAAVHSVRELGDLAKLQLAQLEQGSGSGYPAQPGSRATPGYAAQPQNLDWQGGNRDYSSSDSGDTSVGDDLAGIAISAAARFVGRAIGRRVQRGYEQAMPVLVARQEAVLRDQVAIAERHPDLRACVTDKVIFLAGGNRVAPMGDIMKITPEQADALVATLRTG